MLGGESCSAAAAGRTSREGPGQEGVRGEGGTVSLGLFLSNTNTLKDRVWLLERGMVLTGDFFPGNLHVLSGDRGS